MLLIRIKFVVQWDCLISAYQPDPKGIMLSIMIVFITEEVLIFINRIHNSGA